MGPDAKIWGAVKKADKQYHIWQNQPLFREEGRRRRRTGINPFRIPNRKLTPSKAKTIYWLLCPKMHAKSTQNVRSMQWPRHSLVCIVPNPEKDCRSLYTSANRPCSFHDNQWKQGNLLDHIGLISLGSWKYKVKNSYCQLTPLCSQMLVLIWNDQWYSSTLFSLQCFFQQLCILVAEIYDTGNWFGSSGWHSWEAGCAC